jgi:hypothetical protein
MEIHINSREVHILTPTHHVFIDLETGDIGGETSLPVINLRDDPQPDVDVKPASRLEQQAANARAYSVGYKTGRHLRAYDHNRYATTAERKAYSRGYKSGQQKAREDARGAA